MVSLLRTAAAATWLISFVAAQEPASQAVTRDEILQFYPNGPSAPHMNVVNCKSITQCLLDYPQQLDPSNPDGFEIGLVVNLGYQTRPNDHTCTSGKCLIMNPSHLCNALGPHCLPIHNLRQPLTPCDPSNPYCTSGGFTIDLDSSCHPLDSSCDAGGVFVNPRPCQRSNICPTGIYIPSWIDITIGGGFNVTGPLYPGSYFPLIPDRPKEPGYIIDPTLICPSSIPECQPGRWLIIRPDRECTVGQPGCVGGSQIRNPRHPNLPSSLCPGGGCMVIPMDTSCHPNDFECIGIAVDPVPCPIATRNCHSGLMQPSPFHRCRPGQPGCYGGILWLPPPTLPQTNPPPPQRPSILVPDYEGSIRCSYVEVDHLRPKAPQTPAVKPLYQQPTPDHYIDLGFSQQPMAVPDPQPEIKQPEQEHVPPPQTPQPEPAKEPEKPSQSEQAPPPEKPAQPASTSKFPCSQSDSNPCRGRVVRNWVYGANYWDWSGEHAKPNMPKRTTIGDRNFGQDTILELVDSWFNNAHYTIWIDGEKVAESDEKELMNNRVSCSGGDDCVKKGFSHAWIFVPKGQHKIDIGQTSGFVNGDSDRPYTYGFTQFITRLHAACDSNSCPS